ncbi:hypothetical protein JCM10908_000846 [Rhodotorula pacifica]|uniref:uncharacterized protein n=1 Tax=Rhodotorula pacifica TaxID=1495444 RepID=UPI00317E73B7
MNESERVQHGRTGSGRPHAASRLAQDEEADIQLPLATSLARLALAHPLLATLLIDPLLVRVAHLERAILTSAPARTLLSLGFATERVLIALVAAVGALAAVKWRAQWRAMVYTLAFGDVVRRTVALLALESATSTAAASQGPAAATRRDGQRLDSAREETQHLLSFWLLAALLSFAESFRTTPRHPLADSFASSSSSSRANSISLRVSKTLRALRHSYLQFIRRYILPTLLRTRWAAQRLVTTYPSFDPAPVLAKLPSMPNNYYLRLPFTTASVRGTARPRANFPQPRAHPSDRPPRGTGPIPLAWSWFVSASAITNSSSTGAEVRWTLCKLVLLLLGQRTDALGARNVLWKWGLEPLVAVSARLRGDDDMRGDELFFDIDAREEEPKVEQQQPPRKRRVLPPPSEPEQSFATTVDYSHTANSSQDYSMDAYGHSLAASHEHEDLPASISPYAWTPRHARISRDATLASSSAASRQPRGSAAQSSATSTPRRRRSRSRSISPTPSPSSAARPTSPSPFQLQSPPFLPSGTVAASSPASTARSAPNGHGNGNGTPAGVTYRFASAHHPLLGPRSASSVGSSSAASTSNATGGGGGGGGAQPVPLTASALALAAAAASSRNRGTAGSAVRSSTTGGGRRSYVEEEPEADEEADEDEEEEEDDEGLMTPGEEEAEEGQRKWAGIAV